MRDAGCGMRNAGCGVRGAGCGYGWLKPNPWLYLSIFDKFSYSPTNLNKIHSVRPHIPILEIHLNLNKNIPSRFNHDQTPVGGKMIHIGFIKNIVHAGKNLECCNTELPRNRI